MKTIGLIGGMSWESTLDYYKIINTKIKETLGGLHSAKCILYSVNFDEIEKCQALGDWRKSAIILSHAAKSLENAGADYIGICTNTMHKVVPEIQKNIAIPIIHIADVTANQLIKKNITNVGLLGIKYTMEQDFYKHKLIQKDINVIIPKQEDRIIINNTIYNELCLGIISNESKKAFIHIIEAMISEGAQGIILGCTEIGMLIKQEDTSIELFDTTFLHAEHLALASL